MNKEKLKENCCTLEGQIKRYIDCKGCDKKPKQETFEEAADFFTVVMLLPYLGICNIAESLN